MLDNRTVGKTISALRQANGMTQQQLAATMNVSHQAVSKWETGAALPDMQTMLDLSRMFGVTMEQLLMGDVPEERLHPREDASQERRSEGFQLPDFDLRGAVKGVVEGVGSWFKAPAEENTSADDSAPEAEFEPAEQADKVHTEEAPVDETETDGEAATDAAPVEDAAREEEPSESEAEEPIDIDKIVQMAPFMSRVALEDLLMRYRGKLSAKDVAGLAPFVSSECLEGLIWRVDGTIDWDLLRRLAPFMRRDVVDKIALAIAKGEKLARPAIENIAQAAENFGRNVQRKVGEINLNDLGDKISAGVDSIVRGATEFGEYVAREVGKTFVGDSAQEPQKEKKQRSEQAREARRRMFERAMEEGKWDWIAERLDDLDDAELRAQIAHRATEQGLTDWVTENISDYASAEMIDAALAAHNWEWLKEHLDNIDAAQQERLAREASACNAWDFLEEVLGELSLGSAALDIALAATAANREEALILLAEEHLTEEEIALVASKVIEAESFGLLDALVEHLDAGSVDQICLQLAEKERWEVLEDIIEHADEATVDQVCLRMALHGEWSRVESFLEYASEDAIARLLNLAVDADNWQAIEMLEEYLD